MAVPLGCSVPCKAFQFLLNKSVHPIIGTLPESLSSTQRQRSEKPSVIVFTYDTTLQNDRFSVAGYLMMSFCFFLFYFCDFSTNLWRTFVTFLFYKFIYLFILFFQRFFFFPHCCAPLPLFVSYGDLAILGWQWPHILPLSEHASVSSSTEISVSLQTVPSEFFNVQWNWVENILFGWLE